MDVSDQLQASAALHPGKESQEPIEYEAGGGGNNLDAEAKRQSSSCRESNPVLPDRHLFTVLSELIRLLVACAK
jgi:hypothetical protein